MPRTNRAQISAIVLCAGLTAASRQAAAQRRTNATTSAGAPATPPPVPPPASPAPQVVEQPASDPPPDPRVTEARAHFDQGAVFFERENWEAALAEFHRAYELLEGHPAQYTVLFNLGQTYERLFQYDLALDAYRQYIERGGDAAEDRVTVQATMRALESLLAVINVQTNVPRAEVWLDDRRIGNAPGALRIPGGRHLVQLRAPGFLPNQVEVQIVARAHRDVIVNLTRIPQNRGLPPFLFGTAAGLAVVAAGVGAGFGISALSQRGAIDTLLADPVNRYRAEEIDQRNRDMQSTAVVADVLFGTAGVFAIGAGILFFLTDFRGHRSSEHPTAAPRAWLVPSSSNGVTGITLMGVF